MSEDETTPGTPQKLTRAQRVWWWIHACIASSLALIVIASFSYSIYQEKAQKPPDEWRVTEFDAQVTVHSSGPVDMVETIPHDFGDVPSHSLRRTLPEDDWIDDYGWRDLGLTDVHATSADGGLTVDITPGEVDSEQQKPTRPPGRSRPSASPE